jgi:hypothetical protein
MFLRGVQDELEAKLPVQSHVLLPCGWLLTIGCPTTGINVWACISLSIDNIEITNSTGNKPTWCMTIFVAGLWQVALLKALHEQLVHYGQQVVNHGKAAEGVE